MDGRNEADGVPGESWTDPRDALLVKALTAHPERELIEQRQQETDAIGEPRWSLCRQLEEDGWVEVWLRPWPFDRFDARSPIRVGAWPEQEAELDPLVARAQAIINAYDAVLRLVS
jgi:hypothetical protein